MGLDMFAFAAKAVDVDNDQQTDLNLENVESVQFCYWRKHHDLHGWMHRLYQKKGGKSEEFNCNTLRLSAEDLDALEEAVRNNKLPHTEGFFFGNFPPDEESMKTDLDFIVEARELIKQGYAVFYDSWW